MRISSRQNLALAASLTALMIAAPIAFHMSQREVQGTFGNVATEMPSGGAVTAPSPAQIEVARVEPTVRQGGEPVDGQGPKLALGEAKKVEEAAALAPPREQEDVAQLDPAPAQDGEHYAKAKPANAMPASTAKIAREEGGDDSVANRPALDIRLGRQSLGADNAALGVDRSGTIPTAPNAHAPPAPAARAPAVASLESDASLRGRVAAAAPDAQANRQILDELKYRQAAKPDSLGLTGRSTDQRVAIIQHDEPVPQIAQEENRDKFEAKEINPIKQTAVEPVSTFSIDVDTASYAFVRRALNMGQLPPKDAVRVEEMINYFPYSYPAPDSAETPFKPTVSVFQSPWNKHNKLVHVAVKGYDLKSAERPRANLVFLMDVSGSMQPSDRLPLVKNAFRLLLDQLKPDDTVGIVTYASGSGIALEPTKVSEKGKILAAIDRLGAGGSTAGAAGIADAYRLAETSFDQRAVNRVILATDGDFNVGITSRDELKSFVERKRQSGVFLSILGVGQGNHNDALMQALAQNGNGTAAYVDTLNEARKVLVDEASSTLFTIAKDVKIQIEWNPAAVAEYRLIGYETRGLKREDFNNDRVDAGDIGSGHTVTAIYEVTPVGAPKQVDDLRYAAKKPAAEAAAAEDKVRIEPAALNELGFLKLRYKRPNEDASQLVSLPIADEARTVAGIPTVDVRFSTAVAAFGQIMKGETHTQGYTLDDVLALAQSARGEDPFGYRAEFMNLVRLAKSARE